MMPLWLLMPGEKAEVAEPLMEESLSPCSACMEVSHNHGRQGALLIKVDESRITLNRDMAMKIMVRGK